MSVVRAARAPVACTLVGSFARLAPTCPDDSDALFPAAAAPDLWRYMTQAPAEGRGAFDTHIADLARRRDLVAFTIFDEAAPDTARGYACYMRVEPAHGCIEIGNILFTPALQRSAAATEALFLLLKHAFDDRGFRRVEWKCDTRNAASQAAALRLGFGFEGTFRQHMIVRGENRDTAWFALLDRDWPSCRAAFDQWLAPANFDAAGLQRYGLAAIRRGIAAEG